MTHIATVLLLVSASKLYSQSLDLSFLAGFGEKIRVQVWLREGIGAHDARVAGGCRLTPVAS